MKAALRVNDNGKLGESYIIGQSEYSIGRSAGGWIQIRRGSVSRHQFLVWYASDSDSHMIRDGGGKNPTHLNGKPIHGESRLTPGDIILIGDLALEYLRPAPPNSRVDAHLRDISQNDSDTITLISA